MGLACALLAACVSPAPTPSGTAEASLPPDSPSDEGAARALGQLDWVFSPPANILGGPTGSYSLQAGTLADGEPLVDLEVPWRAELGDGIAREPAVGAPHGGSVVYVADDGARSDVRRAEIAADGADHSLATLDEVVWDIVVAPDGSAAYAAIVDRAKTTRDLGVVRIHLDGSRSVEPVLPPAQLGAADTVRPVAVIAFQVSLAMSLDGEHLIRRTCAEAGSCLVEVAALASGRVAELPDREILGGAAGLIVAQHCDVHGCRLETLDIASSSTASVEVDAFGTVVEVGGAPVVVAMVNDGRDSLTLEAVDPASGRRSLLYRIPDGATMTFGDFLFLTIDVPPGLVHVIETKPIRAGDDTIGMDERHVLVSVADGRIIELPEPAYDAPWTGTQG